MTFAAVLAVAVLIVAGVLRAGAASLARTTRADALRDAAAGRPGAAVVAGLLDEREVVPAISAMHAVLLVAATIPGAFPFVLDLGPGLRIAGAFLWGAVVVLAGDIAPRLLGRRRPRTLAYRVSPLLRAAHRLGRRLTEVAPVESDEQEGDGDHDDEEEALELISSVIEFSDTIVREVMVPRTDMVVIGRDAGFTELLALVAEHGFSRIPVVGEGIDDIIGLVIVKDLLPVLADGRRPQSIARLMRPTDFVPETKKVSDLLKEMQASKSHMSVVIDEYGATAGLVTIEDLLEELVGEIVDEYDDEELLITEREDGVWAVDGRFPVAELSDIVGTELPDEEWDTVAGLVLGLAGRVPKEAERFEVAGLAVTVTRLQGRRVSEVLVERLQPAPTAERH